MALSKAIEFPGNVNLAGNIYASYPGCKVAFIQGSGATLADQLNAYFASLEGINSLYIREVVVPGGLLVFWTRKLSDEEMQAFDAFNMKVEEEMRAWREQQESVKAEVAEREAKELAERERLAGVGRRCEENHGALIKASRRRGHEDPDAG